MLRFRKGTPENVQNRKKSPRLSDFKFQELFAITFDSKQI